MAKIDGTENLADIFTNVLPTATRKKYLEAGIALLLSDWKSGKVGRRRLIPWSRLVRVDLEKTGITLGARFVDSLKSSDRGVCFNGTEV